MKPSIHVDVARQVVEVREGGRLVWTAPVSTSQFGLGEVPDSYKTPRGRHRVAEKFGEGEPLGRVFKGRRPQEQLWSSDPCGGAEEAGQDLILTRILWLAGEEEENRSTQGRYVYFHGTNQEHLIGRPASHGCIRLKNEDMVKLFELAEIGTPVWIG